MAECVICGISFGRMGGGSEPYTGHDLSVCNTCGALFKNANTEYKKNDFHACRENLQALISQIRDPHISAIVVEYGQTLLSEMDPELLAQREKAENEQRKAQEQFEETIENNRENQYKKNAVYEYAVETITDSKVSGAFDKQQVQAVLSTYALKGWRLHSALSNELGKNAIMALGLGVNATVEQTILIFERCIKGEEH